MRRPTFCRSIRAVYQKHFSQISNVQELKATLRAGPLAWPGLYPLYFICKDGKALSFDTVQREFRTIAAAIREGSMPEWEVVACEVNWENPDLVDADTDEKIPCAYSDKIEKTKWFVPVERVESVTHVFEIEASDKSEAHNLAMDAAENFDRWDECQNYEVAFHVREASDRR